MDIITRSENDTDWIIKHTVPLSRMLRLTKNACMDRIVAGLQQGDDTRIQTAASEAMRIWQEEILPGYEGLISRTDIGKMTALRLCESYTDFLCDLSGMMRWCGQSAAAKALLLEAKSRLGIAGAAAGATSDVVLGRVDEELGRLDALARGGRSTIDADTWPDKVPNRVKTSSPESPVPETITLARVRGIYQQKDHLGRQVVEEIIEALLQRFLWEFECDTWDRITDARVTPEEAGLDPETASWIAMREWRDQVIPFYEEAVAMLRVETTTQLHARERYACCCREIACALYEHNAAVKKLLLDARSRLNSDSEVQKAIVRDLAELAEIEHARGGTFDYASWEASMSAAIKYGADPWVRNRAKRTDMQPAPSSNATSGLSQVVGMTSLKEFLINEVVRPMREPALYHRYRVPLPNGILFFGPPGCGKTYIARRLAEELGYSFQEVRPSDTASPFIHETVTKIRQLFVTALANAPSVLFIDEFEAFVPARSGLGGHQQYKSEEVNEFLASLEGCAGRRVLVIAATNEPTQIDSAVRRSGRFDKLVFIPPPDAEARRAMLDYHLEGRPTADSLDVAGITCALEGYSASDIKLVADEAARIALRRAVLINSESLLAAINRVPASISSEDIQRYASFHSRGI